MAVTPTRRRNPERIEARRHQVLEAAVACFRLEGFRGASMAAISARAGMSAGHIYHYFKNKEAIVEAIVDLDKRHVLAHLENLKAEPDILTAILERVGNRLNGCESDYAAFVIEMFAEGTRNVIVGDLIRDRDRLLGRHVQEVLTVGQRQGTIAADIDIANTSGLIAAMLYGADMRLALCPHADRIGMAALTRQVLRHLLSPRR